MPDSNAFTNYNIARLRQSLGENPDKLIVMLGDSKLKYATEAGLLNTPDGWAVIRVVQNRGVFNDFEGLDAEVLAARPDLILIQDSLLYYDRLKVMDFRLTQELVLWQLIAPDSEFNPFRTNQKELQEDIPCSRDFSMEALDRRMRRIDEGSRFGVDHRNSRAAREFIIEATALGIKVAILSLPVHPRLDAELSTADREGMTGQIAGELDAPVWSVPGSLKIGAEDYCDFVHLNNAGRDKLSAWLNTRIAEAIAPQT
jgi:hypothetical protein